MANPTENPAHIRDLLAKLRALCEDIRAPLQERRRAWEKWHSLNARLSQILGESGARPSAIPGEGAGSSTDAGRSWDGWASIVKFWLFLALVDIVLRYLR